MRRSTRAGPEASASLKVTLTALAFTIVAVLPLFLLGGLASLIRDELDFGSAALGAAASCYFGTSALASVPGGRIAQRLGTRRSLASGILLASLSLLGAALMRSWAQLMLIMALAGIANSTVQPAANLALARSVPPRYQGAAFGIKQSAIPAGTLIAGLAVPVVGLTVGWRWAFGGAAVIGILLLAILPRDAEASGRESSSGRLARSRVRALGRSAVALGCGTASANAMSAFFVESAVHLGHTAGTGGLLLAAGSGTGILTRFGSGLLANRLRTDHLRLVGFMMLLGASGFVTLGFAGNLGWLVLGAVISFTAGWGWSTLMHLAIVREHIEAPAEASGIVQAGTFTGGTLGPLLFGWVAATAGYPTAWVAAAVLATLGALLLLWERRDR